MTGARPVPCTARVMLAVALVIGLAGCSAIGQDAPPVHEPAEVEPVQGRAELQVTLDREAVEQISLQTVPVRRLGTMLVVPYAALIYDAHGGSWVYTNPTQRTYLRAPVLVDRSDGDWAWLTRGPAPGTAVVTVGAAELYGAELGIAGGH